MARARRIALWLLLVVLAVLAVLWFVRDLPRREVERRVASAVDGRVRIGRLELIDREHAVLHDVTVTEPRRVPPLVRLTIERLEVGATVESILDGEVRSVRAHGVDAELVPRSLDEDRRDRDDSSAGSPLSIGSIDVDDAAVVLRADSTPGAEILGRGTVDARLALARGAKAPTGSVDARFDRLRLDAVSRIFGLTLPTAVDATELDASIELADVPSIGGLSLEARARRIDGPEWRAWIDAVAVDAALDDDALRFRLSGDSLTRSDDADACCPLVIPSPSIAGTRPATPRADVGLWSARLDSPAWRRGRLVVAEPARAAREQRPRVRLLLDRVDLERTVVPRPPLDPGRPPRGRADLTLDLGRGPRGAGPPVYTLRLEPSLVPLADGGTTYRFAGGTSLDVRGALETRPSDAGVAEWNTPLEATLRLPRPLEPPLAAEAFPLAARAEGSLLLDGFRFAGSIDASPGVLGSLSLRGDASIVDLDLAGGWRGPDVARLLALAGDPLPDGWSLEGRPRGRGRVRGTPTAPRVDGGVTLEDGRLLVDGLEPLPLTLSAAGSVRLDAPHPVAVDRVDAQLDELLTARYRADSMSSGARSSRRLVAGDVELTSEAGLERWRSWLEPALPEALATATLDGRFTTRLALEIDRAADDGPLDWSAAGPLRASGVGYSSADGSRVVQGLDLSLDVDAEGSPDGALDAAAAGRSEGFLLLWQTVFADLSSVGADWRFEIDRAPVDAPVDASPEAPGTIFETTMGVEAHLDDGPAVDLDVTLPAVDDAPLDWTLRVVDEDLESTRDKWLAPVLDDTAPARLEGAASLELEGRLWPTPSEDATGDARRETSFRDTTFSARGVLRLSDLGLTTVDPTRVDPTLLDDATDEPLERLFVDGLDLELPVDLLREDGEVRGSRGLGRLAFERARVGGLSLSAFASPLWSDGDAFGLASAVELGVAGGTVSLENLVVLRLLRPDRRLESTLRLDALELPRLTAQAGLPRIDGRLDGDLPKVRLSADGLQVDGGGVLRLFGGEVHIGDISGTELTTPYPRIRLSADLVDLDLEQITRRVDFGVITGVVRGRIDGLDLFRGVPVAFDARIESVERDGVKQTVDVKAVQNLTILGTGARPTVFDRGLQSLFDRYRYSKLAMSARLADDQLVLRGLAGTTDDGGEYFLRGRFPFAINIINASPGQTVSFQAMVRRLRSIDFSAARQTPPGGSSPAAPPPPATASPSTDSSPADSSPADSSTGSPSESSSPTTSR